MDQDGRQHLVALGPMAVAAARAIRGAWPAIVMAWVARGVLEAAPRLFRAPHIPGAVRAFDPAQTALSLAVGAVVALVSGLLIRRLLEPKVATLRIDLQLAAYVAAMVVWNAIFVGTTILLTPDPHSLSASSVLPRMLGVTGLTVVLELVAAAFALWPIGLLMGDRLPLSRAVRLMAQAYSSFLLASILLALPLILLTPLTLMSRHALTSPVDRLWQVALSSLTTTVSTVILAQIYSQRLRGTDLTAGGATVGAPAAA